MQRKQLLNKLCMLFVMTALLCLSFIGTVSAADENLITACELVQSKKGVTEISIRATLNSEFVSEAGGTSVYLFELLPYHSASEINSLTPVAEAKTASEVKYTVAYSESSLHSKFLIAQKLADGSYAIITNARYIDNPEFLAQATYEYPTPSTKKGLHIQMMTDAQILGVGNTVINVPINEYMLGENSGNVLDFVYNGTTYYISKDKLDLLDYKIKVLSDVGVNVYLNFILTAPTQNTSEKILSMYYENKDSSASLYAYNVKNKVAVDYLEAATTFLAERYTRADRQYGFAGSYIIGFEINSNRVWNNMGEETVDAYLNSYVTAFRTIYTSVRSKYSNARVYISLANNFNAAASAYATVSEPTYDYSARVVLDKFNSKINYSGEVDYRVAINPYNCDLSNPDFWNENSNLTNDTFNTPYITMKNISVICEYLKQEQFLYKGEPRKVLVSAYGYTSGDNSDSSQELQAAAFAYGYYNAAKEDLIEAIIYHRHVDYSGEGNYKFGLWTNVNGTALTPEKTKKIYNVFKYIDTESTEEVTKFALPVLGKTAWSDLIGNFSFDNYKSRKYVEALAADPSDVKKGYSEEIIHDLAGGSLDGFFPSDNCEYIELRKNPDSEEESSMLYAKLSSSIPTEYMGIGRTYYTPFDISEGDYYKLSLMVSAPESVEKVSLSFRLYNNGDTVTGKDVVYECITPVNVNSWQELVFNVKEISENTDADIDAMKILVRPIDEASHVGDYGLWLESVTQCEKRASLIWTVIKTVLIIILVLVALFVLFVAAVIIRDNVRRYRRHKRRQQKIEQQKRLAKERAMRRRMNMTPPPYSAPRQTQNNRMTGRNYRGGMSQNSNPVKREVNRSNENKPKQ